MNIVTIMNYSFTDNRDIVMCLMWAHSIVKSCNSDANITILSETPLPHLLYEYFTSLGISCDVCGTYQDTSLHHNYRFKLYNLTHLDFPYIFLDADIFVMGNMQYLWDRIKDKPWVGINHQLHIPGHTKSKSFLNSGVQLVGDPTFYDFDKIIEVAKENNFKYDIPGKDQAAIWTYFKKIGYDYTHPEIGYEWNACAGYSKLEVDDLSYWHGMSYDLGPSYPVYINHYWHNYKPWLIDCPAYRWYEKNSPIRIEDLA